MDLVSALIVVACAVAIFLLGMATYRAQLKRNPERLEALAKLAKAKAEEARRRMDDLS